MNNKIPMWLLCTICSLPIIGIATALISIGNHNDAKAAQEEPYVETRQLCTMPKYQVGQVVETVIPHSAETNWRWPSHVLNVHKFMDPQNNQCAYTLLIYQDGTQTSWDAWEFQLQPSTGK